MFLFSFCLVFWFSFVFGGPGGGFGGPGGGFLSSSKSSGKATTETIKKKATTRATKTTTKTSPGLAPLPLTPLMLEADERQPGGFGEKSYRKSYTNIWRSKGGGTGAEGGIPCCTLPLSISGFLYKIFQNLR